MIAEKVVLAAEPTPAREPGATEYPPVAGPSPPTYAQSAHGSVPKAPSLSAPQPSAGPNMTAVEIGERYRAELYAQCAQGIHQPSRKYGVCGIISAVLLFPVGLICLFSDSEKKCDRCAVKLS